jgi:hypothetical protein
MGPKETQQMYIRTCIDRSAIVALSAEPPGVNELCVCVYNIFSLFCIFLPILTVLRFDADASSTFLFHAPLSSVLYFALFHSLLFVA